MTSNVGGLDRILRIAAGLALVMFALLGPADLAWKWIGWIGIVPLATGLAGWCPAYRLFDLSTCPVTTR